MNERLIDEASFMSVAVKIVVLLDSDCCVGHGVFSPAAGGLLPLLRACPL